MLLSSLQNRQKTPRLKYPGPPGSVHKAPVCAHSPATGLRTTSLTASPTSSHWIFWPLLFAPSSPCPCLAELSHSVSCLCFCCFLCLECPSHSFSGVMKVIPFFNFLPLIQKHCLRAGSVLGGCGTRKTQAPYELTN